jgi:hypothetical protein
MFRISSLLFLAIAILTGSLLFNTSQSVQRAELDLAAVEDKIASEKESLRVLSAEWDYLNRPERLEKLTLENLDMDDALAKKDDFINDNKAVPEPKAPILPPPKPKDFYQYVSMIKKQKKEQGQEKNRRFVQAPDVIKNNEQENFSDLVEETTEDQL